MQNNKAADPHHPKMFVKTYLNKQGFNVFNYKKDWKCFEMLKVFLALRRVPKHLLKYSCVQNDIAKVILGFTSIPYIEKCLYAISKRHDLPYNENDEIEDSMIAVFKWIMRDIDPFQSAITVLDATRREVEDYKF